MLPERQISRKACQYTVMLNAVAVTARCIECQIERNECLAGDVTPATREFAVLLQGAGYLILNWMCRSLCLLLLHFVIVFVVLVQNDSCGTSRRNWFLPEARRLRAISAALQTQRKRRWVHTYYSGVHREVRWVCRRDNNEKKVIARKRYTSLLFGQYKV